MQGGKAPNAKQVRWHSWLRDRGCCNCGQSAALHHAIGSSGKHNKVHIGQDFVLPLCFDCHQGDDGIHHSMNAFDTDESRKEIEKRLFVELVEIYINENNYPPCSDGVIAAIVDYRR